MENNLFNIDEITDALGKGIDEKVKGTVYHLNRLGIITISSCEGHLDRGLPHFWIDFYDEGNYADKCLDLIYEFNKKNCNLCVDRWHCSSKYKLMICRLMPIGQGKDRYDINQLTLKNFEKYLSEKSLK